LGVGRDLNSTYYVVLEGLVTAGLIYAALIGVLTVHLWRA
jgi:ABC-type arginine/histidine transport system permease subunit